MYKLKERAGRFIDDIENLLYIKIPCTVSIGKRDGKIEFPCDVLGISDGFYPFENGDYFAKDSFDKYALFNITADIPDVCGEDDIYLNIYTNQTGRNMLKPQMLLYKDGKALQGIDTNHRYVKITDLKGNTQEFKLYAFSGIQANHGYSWCGMDEEKGVCLFISVVKRDKRLYKYYISIKTAYSQLGYLDDSSRYYQEILYSLNDSLSLLDLRNPYSREFYESLCNADDLIENSLYSKTYYDTGRATLIGHTHLDIAWLWRYEHTKDKVLRSFATETKLLEEYGEHKFMSSQALLYSFVKEQQPELFERIKEYVRQGRWEAEGAMWVEPDMNLISGESIVRQILYGKRFFNEEFGVDCKVLWLPDVFGYSAALPQILKKSGINYFMTAKMRCNDLNRFPYDTFSWKGIDGTEIFSHLITYLRTVYCPDIEDGEILTGYRDYRQKDINDNILVPFGYADGGGGPTPEQIETVIRLKNGLPGVPRCEYGKVKDYFVSLEDRVKENKRLPVWSGELYFENHRGTYTSMARIKRQNRRAEIMYQNTEWLWSLADRFEKADFPKAEFDGLMKRILINQFHDVLPGSSIKQVYDDSDRLYGEAFGIAQAISDKAIGRMIDRKKTGVTVLNPYSRNVSGYVEYRAERYFVKNVPAKGAVTLSDLKNGPEIPVKVSGNIIENKYYIISIGNNGYIENLYDKLCGRECFKRGRYANKLRVFEDRPAFACESNWNIDNFYTLHEYEMPEPYSIRLIKNTGEYAVIRVERRYQKSIISQDIVVYANSPRIDFETCIDWKEDLQVLKAEFPVDVNAVKARYEIQFGFVERATTQNTVWEQSKFEVCAHKWADISDGGYGMALLNDSKYGYSADGSEISLTLLRSGDSPNADIDREKHYFVYSIIPHSAEYSVEEITKEAYLLNNPLIAIDGALISDTEYSLFNVRGAVLETVKPAEDSDGYILRLYEPCNSSGNVRITAGAEILSAEFTDLLEKSTDVSPVIESNELIFTVKPFEIVTLRVRLN